LGGVKFGRVAENMTYCNLVIYSILLCQCY